MFHRIYVQTNLKPVRDFKLDPDHWTDNGWKKQKLYIGMFHVRSTPDKTTTLEFECCILSGLHQEPLQCLSYDFVW